MAGIQVPWQKIIGSDGKSCYFNPDTFEVTYDIPKVGKPVQTMIRGPRRCPLKTQTGKVAQPSADYGNSSTVGFDVNDDTFLPLGQNVFVTVNRFKGFINIHIREYYQRSSDVMYYPSKHGVTMGPEQWSVFCDHASIILESMFAKESSAISLGHNRDINVKKCGGIVFSHQTPFQTRSISLTPGQILALCERLMNVDAMVAKEQKEHNKESEEQGVDECGTSDSTTQQAEGQQLE